MVMHVCSVAQEITENGCEGNHQEQNGRKEEKRDSLPVKQYWQQNLSFAASMVYDSNLCKNFSASDRKRD